MYASATVTSCSGGIIQPKPQFKFHYIVKRVTGMKKFISHHRLVALIALSCAVVAVAVMFSASGVRAQYKEGQNHVITLGQAVHYIQNFKAKPTAPTTKGGYFSRNIFEKILAQPGTVGIRYYYAAMDDATPTIVLVGVDSTGADMQNGVIGEVTLPCPPYCDSPNSLNK